MARKVLIHTRNLSIPGGKQTYLLALHDHFKSNISYFFYGAQKPVKESAFAFLKRFFGDYYRFYRLLKEGNFDIVHINTSLNFKSYFRDCFFTLISCTLGYKTLVYWHGWEWNFEQKYVRRMTPFFRLTFGKADAMICLSQEFVKKLREYGYQKPIYRETTVVEDRIFNPVLAPKKNKGEKKGKDLLFLSRIEREKGIYELVDSFKQLTSKFPDLRLTVAGVGGELKNVKQYVKKHQLKGVFFPGWISGEEKATTLKNTDLFILPSYSEGMPICVLEAMAAGKPVVVTKVGAIKDFFEEGKMGSSVDIKNTAQLEVAIEALLRDHQLMTQMGTNNSVFARKHFTANLVCERLEGIYEATISGKETTAVNAK